MLLIRASLAVIGSASGAPAAGSFVLVDIDDRYLQRGITARDTWRLNDLRNYAYTLSTLCYCDLIPSARIYVWEGEIAQVVDLTTDEALTDPKLLRKYPTIETLFERIDAGLEHHPHRVDIEHDRYLGYPTRILIDPSRQTADDETDHRISDFYRVERPGSYETPN